MKAGRGEDGSNVSAESPESCRFSGFSLWLLSLLSSLCLSLCYCWLAYMHQWILKKRNGHFAPHFFFLCNILCLFKTFLSFTQPSLLPLLLLSLSCFHFLSDSPANRIQQTRLLFIANSSLFPPPLLSLSLSLALSHPPTSPPWASFCL